MTPVAVLPSPKWFFVIPTGLRSGRSCSSPQRESTLGSLCTAARRVSFKAGKDGLALGLRLLCLSMRAVWLRIAFGFTGRLATSLNSPAEYRQCFARGHHA